MIEFITSIWKNELLLIQILFLYFFVKMLKSSIYIIYLNLIEWHSLWHLKKNRLQQVEREKRLPRDQFDRPIDQARIEEMIAMEEENDYYLDNF